MKNASFFCLVLLLISNGAWVGARPAQQTPPSTPPPPPESTALEDTLILISIDGFRPEYLERGLTPNLTALANDGVMAESMMPQFPSLTFPNHYCIATGMYPINHGIVHNRFYDPVLKRSFSYKDGSEGDPDFWLAEPIWNTVQKYGKKSACMFWPGSDVEILGKRPNYSFVYDGDTPSKVRVDQVIKWLQLPPAKRPAFITLYFSMVDSAGHKYGPDSPELNAALVEINRAIGYLICELKALEMYSNINLILVSDHGMVATNPVEPAIILDTLIDTKKIEWFEPGVIATVIPKKIENVVDFYIALKASTQYKDCLFEVYFKEDLPEEYNYSSSMRIPPLVLIAKNGYYFTSMEAMKTSKSNDYLKGQHGYPVPKNDRNIHAIFIGHGPKFPRNSQSFAKKEKRLPTFSNLELFHLFTKVLAIPTEFRDGNGDLVKQIESMKIKEH